MNFSIVNHEVNQMNCILSKHLNIILGVVVFNCFSCKFIKISRFFFDSFLRIINPKLILKTVFFNFAFFYLRTNFIV